MTQVLQQLPEGAERRRASRYLVELPVEYRASAGQARGQLVSISAVGALVEGVAPRVDGENLVTLMFYCFGTLEPVELSTKLVRIRDSDFTIEFLGADPFLRVMLRVATLHLEKV